MSSSRAKGLIGFMARGTFTAGRAPQLVRMRQKRKIPCPCPKACTGLSSVSHTAAKVKGRITTVTDEVATRIDQ